MNQLMGGTWVGGNVVLTEDSLTFGANKLNRAFQKGELEARFDLADITGAAITGGFGTKIIQVDLADGSQFLFRCTVPDDYLARSGIKPDKSQIDVVWVDLAKLAAAPLYPESLSHWLPEGIQRATAVYLGTME